jgi:hypothetical protein
MECLDWLVGSADYDDVAVGLTGAAGSGVIARNAGVAGEGLGLGTTDQPRCAASTPPVTRKEDLPCSALSMTSSIARPLGLDRCGAGHGIRAMMPCGPSL